jgi:hypothetical protein
LTERSEVVSGSAAETPAAPASTELVPSIPPDDSPTVADFVPALAIVAVDETSEHALVSSRYRGTRRRLGWRRYPLGALAVAALIVLVTLVVALQVLASPDKGNRVSGEPFRAPSPAQLPPGVVPAPTSASPAVSPKSGSPARSRSATPTPSATPAPTTPGQSLSEAGNPPVPLAPTGPPKSASPTAQSGAIVGIGGKCVEVMRDGQVLLETCNGRSTQRWTLSADGTVRAQGGCMDVRGGGTANRTAIQVFDCNGTGAQQWVWRADGSLLNPRSGRCLDAEGAATDDGTRLIIWDCHGGPNQRWRLT